jgi:hypothetical protein
MSTVTLARALKYKNRVKEMLQKVQRNIINFNSIMEGAEEEVNVATAMERRAFLEKHLVELKCKVDEANTPIKQDIFAMQEIRARIVFLREISTSHGKVLKSIRFGEDKEMTYQATFRKVDIDKMVVEAEEQLDDLQEKLDHFNNTTTIEIDLVSARD